MNIIDKTQITSALSAFKDPYLQQDWVTAKAVDRVEVQGGHVNITVALGYPVSAAVQRQLSEQAVKHLACHFPEANTTILFKQAISAHRVQQGVKSIQSIKNIIAVGSGKGGVGKSTVSANLAVALAQLGAKVGLLDADIYGPSQAQLFGIYDTPTLTPEKRLMPLDRHGVKMMSIANLVDINQAMIWRGPMVSSALQQLLNDTLWGELDYLIIDLPPGTGDIQLTLSQKIPVSGAVIVTTPQDLALLDAKRAIAMFDKVKIPVLGLIENMSLHRCSQCGHEEPIFGSDGGKNLAIDRRLPLLAQLPLDIAVRRQADVGTPLVAAQPDNPLSKHFIDAALALTATLSLQAKNYASKFPNIVIEND